MSGLDFVITNTEVGVEKEGTNAPRLRANSGAFWPEEPTGYLAAEITAYEVCRRVLDPTQETKIGDGPFSAPNDKSHVRYHVYQSTGTNNQDIGFDTNQFGIDYVEEYYLSCVGQNNTARLYADGGTTNVIDYGCGNVVFYIAPEYDVAYSIGARWTGGDDSAVGERSFCHGSYSLGWEGGTAIGWNAYTSGTGLADTKTAIGKSSYAGSSGATAIGHNAHATTNYGVCIGADSDAADTYAVVIGRIAATLEGHQIAFGEAAHPIHYFEISSACDETNYQHRGGWLRLLNDFVTTSGQHWLALGNNTNEFPIPADSCMAFYGIINGIRDTLTSWGSYYVEGYVHRATTAASTAGGLTTTTTLSQSGSPGAPTFVVDTTNGEAGFQVVGAASQNWQWGGFIFFSHAEI